MTVRALERERLDLQQELDGAKTQSERNRLGQFATPTALAEDILRAALEMVPAEKAIRFLDPAFGTGAFFSALLKCSRGRRIEAADGVEIDPHYGVAAQDFWGKTKLHLQLADFTTLRPPMAVADCYNLLVCNPPYVRHHHLGIADKQRLRAATERVSGVRLSGLAGLYCHFVGLSHAWMQPDAVGVWLIPSEFMDVNYGDALKRYLLRDVTVTRIHRYDPNEVQFADALVSSAVVFLRKTPSAPTDSVRFTLGGSLGTPKVTRDVAVSELLREPKWSRFPSQGTRAAPPRYRLSDLFEVKRGIATGANSFFILTEAQVKELTLPGAVLRPILPSPRHIPTDEIAADKNGVPLLDRRLFLLDCRLPQDVVRQRYPELWAYLQTGQGRVSDGYLCRSRREWYYQEERPAAPIVCTYLGRSDTKDHRPFRFLLNRSEATAHNVYLLLYPRAHVRQALSADRHLLRRIWEGLNLLPADVLLGEGRVYGGGLHKMEPRELGNIDATWIVDLAPDLLGNGASEQLALWERGQRENPITSTHATLPASGVRP